MDRSGFCEPHFAAKARVTPLGSPSAMNMLASLVRRMFAFAYGENEFKLLQMKGLVWGTGQALLRSPRGRKASRNGLVKLGWVHCLQYTLNCFQYNVCGLCRCEPSNHSYHPVYQKVSVARTLFSRANKISSNNKIKDRRVLSNNKTLKNNGCPSNKFSFK